MIDPKKLEKVYVWDGVKRPLTPNKRYPITGKGGGFCVSVRGSSELSF